MLYLLNPFQGQLRYDHWCRLQTVVLVLAIVGMLLTALLYAGLELVLAARGNGPFAAVSLFSISIFYMSFSSCMNRLRCVGRSGLWLYAFAVSAFGLLVIMYAGWPGGLSHDVSVGSFSRHDYLLLLAMILPYAGSGLMTCFCVMEAGNRGRPAVPRYDPGLGHSDPMLDREGGLAAWDDRIVAESGTG